MHWVPQRVVGCRPAARPEMTEWSSFASSATVTAAAEARVSSRLQKSERVECSTGCPEGARRAAGASLRTHAEMPRRNEPGGAAPETAQAAAAPPLPPFRSPARCSDAAAGNPCFNSHLLGRAVPAAARRLLASRSRDQHPAAPRWHVTSGPWNTAAAEGRLRARRQRQAGRFDKRARHARTAAQAARHLKQRRLDGRTPGQAACRQLPPARPPCQDLAGLTFC